jgi:undecaprenyl-diphosphatase
LTVNVLVRGPLIPVDRRIHKSVRHTAISATWNWTKTGPFSPARLIVDLGNPWVAIPVLIVITTVVAVRRHSLRPLLTAATGLVLLAAIVIPAKVLIGRPSPGYSHLLPHQVLGAFPSGHTATASVCYFLAVLVSAPEPAARGRHIALRAAAVLSFLVGVAMLWCSMHWFTDVVAAWALAALIVPVTMKLTGPRAGPGQTRQERPAEPRPLAASTDPGSG